MSDVAKVLNQQPKTDVFDEAFLAKFPFLRTSSQINHTEYPEPEWLIDKILPKEGTALLGGKYKAGKSYFALWIIKQVTEMGVPVYYYSAEDRETRIKTRMAKFGIDTNGIVFHCGKTRPIERDKHSGYLPTMKRILQAKPEIGLVVLDPMVSALAEVKGIDKQYSQTYSENDQWNLLAEAHNTVILMTHHGGKGDKGTFDDFLGSTATPASFDTLLFLRKLDRHNLTLMVDGKDFDGEETYRYKRIDKGFEYVGLESEASLGEQQDNVLQTIRFDPGKYTITKLSIRLGMDKGNCSRRVTSLCRDGFIYTDNKGMLFPDIT